MNYHSALTEHRGCLYTCTRVRCNATETRSKQGDTVAKTNKISRAIENKSKIKQKLLQIVKPLYSQTSYTSYVFHVFNSEFVIFNKVYSLWDFPGGPEVETLPSNAGGVGLILSQGTKVPQSCRVQPKFFLKNK